MAAVYQRKVRRVKVMLALGVDPNRPVTDAFWSAPLNFSFYVPSFLL